MPQRISPLLIPSSMSHSASMERCDGRGLRAGQIVLLEPPELRRYNGSPIDRYTEDEQDLIYRDARWCRILAVEVSGGNVRLTCLYADSLTYVRNQPSNVMWIIA